MMAYRHALAVIAMAAASCVLAGDYNYNFLSHPATGINAHGIAIINCDCGSGGTGRASFYRNGVMTPISPPGMGPSSDIVAVAINNRDQILVRSHKVATAQQGYFLYDIDRQQYRLVSNRGRLVSNPARIELSFGETATRYPGALRRVATIEPLGLPGVGPPQPW